MKLTPKRKAFVEAYTGNATEAALSAGYSPKTAHAIGHELLKKPEIQEALQKRMDKKINSIIADREERQAFWTEVMRDEFKDMKDRLKASELLARSEGDFLERIETQTIDCPVITVNFVEAEPGSLAGSDSVVFPALHD